MSRPLLSSFVLFLSLLAFGCTASPPRVIGNPLVRVDASIPDAAEPDAWIPPGAVCGGNATSCSDVGRCRSQAGCRTTGRCTGIALRCADLELETECRQQRDCSWNGTACWGGARDCSSFHTAEDCSAQLRCDWATTCTGSATSCAAIEPARCERQAGCELRY